MRRPPAPAVVAELVRAGLSPATVLAMEAWKAQEVLELLRGSRLEVRLEAPSPGA